MTTPDPASQLDEGLLVLFDGHALFHRAFHAIRTPLSVSATGEQTAAVYGFAASIIKTVSQMKPAHAAVAFDLSAPTFRHRSFAEYKAQRPPMPDAMRDQFGRIREVVHVLGLPVFEVEGYEADDVLGCLAVRASQEGLRDDRRHRRHGHDAAGVAVRVGPAATRLAGGVPVRPRRGV